MTKLSATIYNSTATTTLAVGITREPYAMTFSHGQHGCESCTLRYQVPAYEALKLLSGGSVYHVVISALGAPVWSGRAENVNIIDDGVEIVAYGYWRALLDQPYTTLWTDTSVSGWRPILSTEMSDRYQSRWTYDTQNRIFITANTGDTFGNSPYIVGSMYYAVPSGSSRTITAIDFDFVCDFAGTWVVGLERLDASFTSLTQPWTRSTTGTGSQSLTFTGCNGLNFFMYYNGANAVNTAETGRNYLRITNLRVKTTTSSTVTPTDIIGDMTSLAPALASSSQVGTNTIDLKDVVFEDQYPGDIIEYLTSLGDASGNRWEAGVNENRELYYRSMGSTAREWQADLLEVDFARSISEMWNSVYAVYKDASGVALRGTASTDSTSVNTWGITRKLALTTDTTNSTQANYHRDVALADRKNPAIKTQLRINPVGWADLWAIKAGDYINIRNLPPMFQNYTNVTRFRIARSEFDAASNSLTLETESPLATLDFVVAREAVGLSRSYERAMDRIRRQ
jgi:hypothetical protein